VREKKKRGEKKKRVNVPVFTSLKRKGKICGRGAISLISRMAYVRGRGKAPLSLEKGWRGGGPIVRERGRDAF